MNCAKTAEAINLPFGLWTQVGQRKHKFNHIRQLAHWHNLQIRLNHPSAAAIRPYVKLL